MKSLIDSFDTGRDDIERLVAASLKGSDDGELFIEYREAEALVFDNGRLKTGSFNQDQGFGLRSVAGEAIGYAHAGDLSMAALKRASDAVSATIKGYGGTYAAAPAGTNRHLYTDENPIGSPTFDAKVQLLQQIDGYLRAKDPKVRQVSVSLAGSWQQVEILRADGHFVRDIRPMVRLTVSVVAGSGDRQESGSHTLGGRKGFGEFITVESWRHAADEALRQALVNLEAIPAPAGTFDIVLANGWPGVMLHEAVGHGLEGDFNRKKTSAFAGLLGQQVASKGVTVVDDGTIAERRGSLTIDDEGTPTNRTVLIDDGKLVNYMQDRQNARLMGMEATGNGRRESYAHAPMPRQDAGRDHCLHEERHLCRFVWRRTGGHHLRQVRVRLHGSLYDRGRQGCRTDQGRHADRQWSRCHAAHFDDRQRHETRYRQRQLRQGRPVGSRRGWPAASAHGSGHCGRHGGLIDRRFATEVQRI
jgi:TldD protein